LAKALVLEASDNRPNNTNNRMCRADPQVLADLDRRG
jgi:hypothetical protein